MMMLFCGIYSEKLECDKYQMELKEPVELVRLLEHVEKVFPQLADGHRNSVKDRYAAHYLCMGAGRILGLKDIIKDSDTVEMIPPVMGG